MAEPGNGLTRWLLGAVFSVAVLLTGFASSASLNRMQTLEVVVQQQERAMAQRGERLATVENEQRNLKLQLDRIEAKLDRVLSR